MSGGIIESGTDIDYDRDAVVFLNLQEDLDCPICFNPLSSPLLSKCSHSYCKKCILRVLQAKQECCICRKFLSAELLFPNLLVAKIIESSSIYCRYGLKRKSCNDEWKVDEEGCKEITTLTDRKSHETVCKFFPLSCKYSTECGLIKRFQFDEHLTECEYRPVPCPKGCAIPSLRFRDLESHYSTICPKVTIPCWRCTDVLERGNMLQHVSECIMVMVKCENKESAKKDNPSGFKIAERCKWWGFRKDLDEHLKKCEFRKVNCVNEGCEEEISFKYLPKHKEECEWRKVVCSNEGCGKIFTKIYLLDHQMLDCETQIIACSICGEKVIRADLSDHEKQNVVVHMSKVFQKMKGLEEENKALKITVNKLKDKFQHLQKSSKKKGTIKETNKNNSKKSSKSWGIKVPRNNNKNSKNNSNSNSTNNSVDSNDNNSNTESEEDDKKLYEEVLDWEEKVVAYGENISHMTPPLYDSEQEEDDYFNSLIMQNESESITTATATTTTTSSSSSTLASNKPTLVLISAPKRKFSDAFEISTTQSIAKDSDDEQDEQQLLEEVLDWEDSVLKSYSSFQG